MNDAPVVPIRRPRRGWLAQWPMILVLIGVAIALVLIGADYFRRGCVVLSASVLLAAFLRQRLFLSICCALPVIVFLLRRPAKRCNIR